MWSKVIFGHRRWPPAAILWTKKLRIDLKWWEMWSKVFLVIHNGRRQPFWEKNVYLSEMARNAIESDFWSSKMATGSHIVKKNQSCVLIWNGEKCDRKRFSVIQNGHRQPFCEKKKLCIYLKWQEMRSKVIFGHPKWPPAAILWKKIKVAYWSEMPRNAIESDFWSSNMAAGSHFVNKIVYLSEMARNAIESTDEKNQKNQVVIDLKCREMRSKVIFGHPKWPPAAI